MQGIEMADSPQEGKAAERRIGDAEIPNASPTHTATFTLDIAVLGGTNPAALLSPPKAARATKAKSKSKSKTAVVSKPTKRKSRAEPKDKPVPTSATGNSASTLTSGTVSAMVDEPPPQMAPVRSDPRDNERRYPNRAKRQRAMMLLMIAVKRNSVQLVERVARRFR
jgi:hypothetical protein